MRRRPTPRRTRRHQDSPSADRRSTRPNTSETDHRTAVVVRASAVVRAVASVLRLLWDVST